MISGRRYSPEQIRAYSSFVSVERMKDDLQSVGSLAILAAMMPFIDVLTPARAVAVMAVLLALMTFLGRWSVSRLIDRMAPPHVASRLPRGPFDGPSTPGAPHTYADLARLWRDPAWVCSKHVYALSPSSMPMSRVIAFAAILFAGPLLLGVTAYLWTARVVWLAAIVVAAQVMVTMRFARVARSTAVNSPTRTEIGATFAVACVMTIAVAAVAIARS